jgi:hypothetical protein
LTPGPAKPPFESGLNIHLDRGPRLALARELGAAWVRIDLNWDGIEPSPGKFDFSAPDLSIQDACGQGLKIYATLAYAPAWASRHGKNISVPDPQAWQNFVRTAARRYRGQVTAYGIWNEPNLEEFWEGSAADYVEVILKPAWHAIKSEAPETIVAGPDLAHLYSARLGIQDFFSTLKIMEGDRYLDVLSHHVYGESDFVPKFLGFKFAEFTYKPGLLQMLEKSGLAHKEIWITEVGANSASLGEAGQARAIAAQISFLRTQPWISKAFVYQLSDDEGDGAKWGLVRTDGTLKPAYFHLQTIIGKAGGV